MCFNNVIIKEYSIFADMTEHKRVFATLIARNAKDIDALIESLPSEDSSAELQVRRICKKQFHVTLHMSVLL